MEELEEKMQAKLKEGNELLEKAKKTEGEEDGDDKKKEASKDDDKKEAAEKEDEAAVDEMPDIPSLNLN